MRRRRLHAQAPQHRPGRQDVGHEAGAVQGQRRQRAKVGGGEKQAAGAGEAGERRLHRAGPQRRAGRQHAERRLGRRSRGCGGGAGERVLDHRAIGPGHARQRHLPRGEAPPGLADAPRQPRVARERRQRGGERRHGADQRDVQHRFPRQLRIARGVGDDAAGAGGEAAGERAGALAQGGEAQVHQRVGGGDVRVQRLLLQPTRDAGAGEEGGARGDAGGERELLRPLGAGMDPSQIGAGGDRLVQRLDQPVEALGGGREAGGQHQEGAVRDAEAGARRGAAGHGDRRQQVRHHGDMGGARRAMQGVQAPGGEAGMDNHGTGARQRLPGQIEQRVVGAGGDAPVAELPREGRQRRMGVGHAGEDRRHPLPRRLVQVQQAGVVQGDDAGMPAQRPQNKAMPRIVAELVQHPPARCDMPVRQRGIEHPDAGRRLGQPVRAGGGAVVVLGQGAEQQEGVVGDAVALRRQRGEHRERAARRRRHSFPEAFLRCVRPGR